MRLICTAVLLLGLAAPVSGQTEDPGAARDLGRGVVLTPADISGPLTEAGVAPGWVTRRVMRAGEVLREPAVRPPMAVAAGDAVDLVWRGQGVEVRRSGVATGPAGIGERVTVRLDGRRRLDGTVEAPGLVRLN
jgi:flagella basal body P-ring formation protein FlgA